MTPYHVKLLALLSVATFFEGFDMIALTQVLPEMRAEFGLGEAGGGLVVSAASLGTVLGFLLVRSADRYGRRAVLMVTIAGYTVFSGLTAAAPGPAAFAAAQLIARVFLIGEWAIAMVYAAEEFPAARRGLAIGLIQAFSTLGSIACAAVAPLLLRTALGWRSVYLVGVVPLVLVAIARRGLRESGRFSAERAAGPAAGARGAGLLAIWRTPHARRVAQMALIWALTYACTNTAVTFWKEFAMRERGLTAGEVGGSIAIAALGSAPAVFGVSWLLDAWGRRRTAVLVFAATAVGVALAYRLHGLWQLRAALTVAIWGVSSVLPVLNAYTAELFPTAMRASAFAWSNNLLGRLGYVLAPSLAGALAAGPLGWSGAVGSTAVLPLLALALILLWLPETAGRDLDETSRA